MSGYWKFNSSLLAEDDFRNQLELMIKRELTGAIMGNRWWANLKDSIRSFSTDYGRRLKSGRVAEQRSIKDNLDRVVLAGDSVQVNVAKAELASLQIKEYQALVVRARLKRMSCEATNMAQELRAEELRQIGISSVSHRRMGNVELQTKPSVGSSGSISWNFSPGSPDWALLSSTPILPTSLAFRRLKRLGVRGA